MGPRILVSGATGFVGGHLLAQIARDDPGATVHAWRRPGEAPRMTLLATPTPVTLEWTAVELLDPDSVGRAVSAARPDHVYHLAGVSHVGFAWRETAATFEVNVYGTHVLLEAIARTNRAARVLIPGSATVYAPSEGALHEDSPVAPSSPYALSKLAQEMLGARVALEEGGHVLLVRAFNHIGPGQDPSFFAPSFARQLARIEAGLAPPVLRVGNLDARRDLTDVRDTVRAYRALMAGGAPARPYNVCSGQARSIREILDEFLALCRVPVTVETDPAKLRPNDMPLVLGSYERLRRDTGWEPQISLESTIRDILEDARTRWTGTPR